MSVTPKTSQFGYEHLLSVHSLSPPPNIQVDRAWACLPGNEHMFFNQTRIKSYVWLKDGREFWVYVVYFDALFVYGYQWYNNDWIPAVFPRMLLITYY